MKTLIVSATYNEISNLINKLDLKKETYILYKSNTIDVLISGIGSAFTIYNLTEHLQKHNYNLIINVGIAGAFNKNLNIGDTVIVNSDCFADLGIDDNGNFKTLFEEKLISKKINLQFENNISLQKLPKVKSITVNTASGSEQKIELLVKKFNPDIETMEGASVTFIANKKNIPIIQIRTISNYVEPRNKSNWNINLAITNLNNVLIKLPIAK